MKRDPTSFNPSSSTKVCTDHFFLTDFREADLSAHQVQAAQPEELWKVVPIHLKSDSIPKTDRATGIFADPLCQNYNTRQPPRVREQTSRAASSEVDDVMFNPGPSCPANCDLDIDLQNIEDEDDMISSGSETKLDEDLELVEIVQIVHREKWSVAIVCRS